MVYGNVNQNSGTGVCFTRNPANGTKELFGEYLANAQVRAHSPCVRVWILHGRNRDHRPCRGGRISSEAACARLGHLGTRATRQPAAHGYARQHAGGRRGSVSGPTTSLLARRGGGAVVARRQRWCVRVCAQGEDVVAGIRTPVPIAEMAKLMPAQHQELVDVTTRLEAHMRDMQVRAALRALGQACRSHHGAAPLLPQPGAGAWERALRDVAVLARSLRSASSWPTS